MFSFPDLLTIDPLWVAIPLALIPGALQWWWARTVTAGGNMSALPERHLSLIQRVSGVTTLCTLGIVFLTTWLAIWILPLEFVVLAGATYRTRRVLFGETVPFQRYLLWRTRLIIGWTGLWWFITFAPTFVTSPESGRRWWIAGGVLLVALAWHHWHSRVLLRIFGASPLSRPDLDGLLDEVIRRAQVTAPAIYRAGERGAVFANALALPSLSHTAVLFFDTLLERLTPREITAIFAHEVAHLEHYHRRRLVRFYVVTVVFITVFVVSAAAAWPIAPEIATWLPLLSFFTVFGGLWLRARRMQPKETEADLRAIELCRDPDALVSALTRLHEIAHMPRRWSVQMEERATHPSLARRINAIRRLTSAPSAPVAIARVLVESPEQGRRAFIDHDRVGFLWLAPDTAVDSADVFAHATRAEMFAYANLSELRVAPRRGDGLMLTAVDRTGRRVSMPIYERDAAQLQTALDAVDHLVVAPVTTGRALAPRLVALLATFVAFALNALIPVLMPALLALRHPSRALLTAIAGGLTGVALLRALEPVVDWSGVIIPVVLAGITLLAARTSRQATPGHQASIWQWTERIALAMPVAIGVALLLATARDLYGLHTGARDQSWVASASIALAGFLGVSVDRVSRRFSAVVAVAAAFVAFAGSPQFLLDVVRDPLATAMPSMIETRTRLAAGNHQTVAGEFQYVATTIEGSSYLLAAEEEEPDDDATPPPRNYVAGGFDGWTRALQASEAVIIDEQRLLVLERDGGTSRLHAEEMHTGQPLWTSPPIKGELTMLQAEPGGRWRSIYRHGNQFTRVEGRVGSSDTQDTSWSIPANGHGYVSYPAIDEGPIALATATTWIRPAIPWLTHTWRESTTVIRAGVEGASAVAASHLSLDCPPPPIGIAGYVCISFDGRTSRVWRFDQASGRFMPIGESRHPLWQPHHLTATRLAGRIGADLLLMDLDSRTIQRLSLPWDGCWMNDFAIGGDQLVTVCAQDGSTRITRYRIRT